MRFLILLFLLTITPTSLHAQSVYGYVEDANSGERLIGATIRVINQPKGSVSNAQGYWHITMGSRGAFQLKASYLGYRDTVLVLQQMPEKPVFIQLRPIPIEASGVEITAQNETWMDSGTSVITLPISEIQRRITVLGEKDVLKTLQQMPGVQGGVEGSSTIIVRGGNADQNLILLDGTPVYNATHLFGFLSVFNTDALQHVELIKGGFPARYGGRLSSVLDVQMKEGNARRFSGSGGIGLLSSRLTLEGPLRKDRLSFMVSGRTTYVSELANLYIRMNQDKLTGTAQLGFYDLNAKINYTFSPKSRWFYSYYVGKDLYGSDSREDFPPSKAGELPTFDHFVAQLDWKSATHAFRWHYLAKPYLFVNTGLMASSFQFGAFNLRRMGNLDAEGNDLLTYRFYVQYLSAIRDLGLRSDADYLRFPQHQIKFGVGLTRHRFKPQILQQQSTSIDPQSFEAAINSLESYVYAEDTWAFREHWKTNVGLRISANSVQKHHSVALEPRFMLQRDFQNGARLNLSGSRTNQYVHLLSNFGIGMPTDLWIPSTRMIRPQQAWQVSFGGTFPTSKKLRLRSELFYKWMNQVLAYKEGASIVGNNLNWESQLTQGKGWAYGWESEWLYQTDRIQLTLAYTWLKSMRQYEELNGKTAFPDRYDRRHNLNINTEFKLSRKASFQVNWTYQSGMMVTLPNLYLIVLGPEPAYLGEYYATLNNYRMPAHHRLDLGFSFNLPRRRTERSLEIGVYNAYNRKNISFLRRDGHVLKGLSLLPILPFIGYNFNF